MRCSLGLLGGSLVLLLLGPGCGLTLDYDPPEDGGIDVLGIDAPLPDASLGCQTDVECSDGDLCNGTERCVSLRCEQGTPVNCEDGDVCDGVDTCDSDTGECVTAPVASCEDDGDVCNGDEVCDPVVGCAHVRPLDCDDGVACTHDECTRDAGCTSTPNDEVCDIVAGGVCLPDGCAYPTCEVGRTCTSDNPCLVPHCDAEGTCVREPMVCAGTDQACCGGVCVPLGCDDGVECTADRCSRTDGCVNVPLSGVSCEDGDRCTVRDACADGVCLAGAARPCMDRDPCVGGRCEPSTGECVTVRLDGVPCVDADACTRDDVCVDGFCTSGTEVDCDDGEFCTADACDGVTGCSHTALRDGTTCPGIVASACVAGRCVGTFMCPPGTADCDADGDCECRGVCDGTAGASLCVASVDCRATGCASGLSCCELSTSTSVGACVPVGCASCCVGR